MGKVTTRRRGIFGRFDNNNNTLLAGFINGCDDEQCKCEAKDDLDEIIKHIESDKVINSVDKHINSINDDENV